MTQHKITQAVAGIKQKFKWKKTSDKIKKYKQNKFYFINLLKSFFV